MRTKAVRWFCAIALLALTAGAGTVRAAEPAAGDACTTLNNIVETGGPETTGVRNILRCNGTTWQQEMTIDAAGKVGIGTNTTTGSKLRILDTGSQLDLAYDASNVAKFQVDSAGALTLTKNPGTAFSTADTFTLNNTGAWSTTVLNISNSLAAGYSQININSSGFIIKNDKNADATFIQDGSTNGLTISSTVGANAPIIFKPHNSESVRFTYDGKVGIGPNAASPGATLDDSGSIALYP